MESLEGSAFEIQNFEFKFEFLKLLNQVASESNGHTVLQLAILKN